MSRVSLKSRLLETTNTRILYARFISFVLSFLLGILILAYTLHFFYVFETIDNTTSYFPWAWQRFYDTQGPVVVLTDIGIILSVAVTSVSAAGALFFYRVLQRYSRSRASDSLSTASEVFIPSRPPRKGMLGLDKPTTVSLIALALDLFGISLVLVSGEREGLLIVAGASIIAGLFGAAYFALDTFFPKRK